MHTQIMPKMITDERVDYLVDLFNLVKISRKLILSFGKNEVVSAAGMALLCNFLDSISESKCEIEILNIDNQNSQHVRIANLVKELQATTGFISSDNFQFENESSINWF